MLRDGKFARFGSVMDRCFGSFAERRFLEGLLMSEMYSFEPMDPNAVQVARDDFGIELGVQVPVGPYFLDFVLSRARCPVRLAIEIDGHAFHRRTAEEAEREARRDRFIVEEGYTLVRYMAKEVMGAPRKVANDAYRRIFRHIPRGPGMAKVEQRPFVNGVRPAGAK